ncbi:ArsR/SmtB family transcription factor [Haloferula sargassicola]|uniref:HTH arsR-type domain-containing protein n=1 Tax=Haloferula sargassicola TaxID=490096 RepID=A0ABP9UNT8_9BACT
MATQSIDRRVRSIKALAHPARLQIVQALEDGPRCVSELQAMVGSDMSTVSKHLVLLREAGWVSCEKTGLQVHYRLACVCLATFLRCIDSLDSPDSGCC